jgi:gamma-carbonic anhydrase
MSAGVPPILWHNFRQVMGRALRETGQMLHRLGVKTTSLAITKHDYYDDPVIYEDHLSRHRQLFPMLICGRPVLHQHIAYVAPCATLIGSVYVGQNSSIWYGAVLRGDACENTPSLLTRYKIEDGVVPDTATTTTTTTTTAMVEDGEIKRLSSTTTPNDENGYSSSSTDNDTDKLIVSKRNHDTTLRATTRAPLQDVPKPWKLSETRYKDQLDHHGGAIFIGDNTNVQDAVIITSYQDHCTIGSNVTIGHSAQLHSCTVQDNVLIGMGSIINMGAVIESHAFIAAGAVIPGNTVVPTGTLWMGNPARYVRDLTTEQRDKIAYQSSEYVQVALTHQHIMELGGNIDPETGAAVYITSDAADGDDVDDVDAVEQLQSPSTNTSAGSINGATSESVPLPQQQLASKADIVEIENETLKVMNNSR